ELAQYRVARGVPESVVDLLEMIDVQIQQRYRPAVALVAQDRKLDAFLEVQAVGQSGQGVVTRQPFQLALGQLELRDIECDRVETHHSAVGVDVRHISRLVVMMAALKIALDSKRDGHAAERRIHIWL